MPSTYDLAVFSCTCPNARTHTLQRRCQRWLDGFGEDRYHLRQEVIAFAQTTDEVQALFGEEEDVMAGPRAKQLDGYVGATIDDEASDSSLSTATSFATTTHDRPEERRK